MKAIRRPMFWYNLLMWLVSGIFSVLLIQLGALIMSDVPTAGKRISRDDYVDAQALAQVDDQIGQLQNQLEQNANQIEDAQFVLRSRTLDYQNQKANFESWIQTRSATQQDSQNDEVVARVRAIEALKLLEREAEQEIEGLRQNAVQMQRDLTAQREIRSQTVQAADVPYQRARSFEVLKVFGFRLALTLPLLLVAGWMAFRKRHSPYWPIYRGFIIFALFAFFVELVPYLPTYGGYVRYIVGIVLALLFAHFATKSMARYLRNKKEEESRPETEKRKTIAYETAVKQISSGVCPSCDRQFGAVKGRKGDATPPPDVDYCVHCGFCLFRACANCGQRENSFYKFCGACGTEQAEPA